MNNIAVILAKKDSKRLPNKNFLEFNGLPILNNSTEAAEKTKLFDTVIISTDIEGLHTWEPCKIYKRSAENTKEDSTMYDALMEVLDVYKGNDNVCLIYACNPLLKAEYITRAYEVLKQGYDTLMPVVKDDSINRCLIKEKDKYYSFYPVYDNVNTQQQENKYKHTGMFYWCNIEALRKNKSIMNGNMGAIELNKMQCQDIDDAEDWEIALWKYKRRNK